MILNFLGKLSFKKKILMALIVFSSIGIYAVAQISYIQSRSALEELSIKQMESMAIARADTVEGRFKQAFAFTKEKSLDRWIEGLFLAYESAFYGNGMSPGKDESVYLGAYKDLDKLYLARTQQMIENESFDDMILIAINGQIIMVTKDAANSPYLGKNVLNGVYQDSGLAKCFSEASASKEIGEVFFSNYNVDPVTGKAGAYLCVKEYAEYDHLSEGISKGDVMGIVATKISTEEINDLMKNRVGMGETGQGYLVGADKLLRSDFSFKEETYNTSNSLKNKLEITTSTVTKALEGTPNHNYVVDPLGYDVLSYSYPIKVFGQEWALVFEKRASEIFASLRSMIVSTIILSIVAMLVIVFVAGFSLNRLMEPVTQSNQILDEVCDVVNSNSNEMEEYSVELNTVGNSVSSAFQEIVATLEEVNSMVQSNLRNITASNDKAEQTFQSAEHGREKIQEMVVAMDQIKSSNEDFGSKMMVLSDKMAEITTVITNVIDKTTVINDIVFQTKLLSFNASVEAARAGEHGKGFSIVAEEVGALAAESGKASMEIAQLLESSFRTVEQLSNDVKSQINTSLEENSHTVESGLQRVKQTEQAFTEIIGNIRDVTSKIGEVTIASNEQATGIDEVTKAINGISDSVDKTATISNQVMGSAKSMKSKSDDLSSVVTKLREIFFGVRDSTSESRIS